MTRVIEKLTYPDPGREMLKDKTLGPILRAILKQNTQAENYLFLDAVAKRESYSNLYKGFIDRKAKHMVNIGHATREPMEEPGAMGNFYDKKFWKDAIGAAATEIDSLIDANITDDMLMQNKAFRAHHYSRVWYKRANFYKQWKKSKEMKKVHKFLGDTLDVTQRTLVIEAYAALKYKPSASKKAMNAVANASGKKPHEVRSVFKKVFGFA